MTKLTPNEAAQAKLIAIRLCQHRTENGTPPGSAWAQYEADCACIDALVERGE